MDLKEIAGPEDDYKGPLLGLGGGHDTWKGAVEKLNHNFKHIEETIEGDMLTAFRSMQSRIRSLEEKMKAMTPADVPTAVAEQPASGDEVKPAEATEPPPPPNLAPPDTPPPPHDDEVPDTPPPPPELVDEAKDETASG